MGHGAGLKSFRRDEEESYILKPWEMVASVDDLGDGGPRDLGARETGVQANKARDLREALRQKKLRIFITRKGGLVIHSMTTASHTTLQFILTYFHFILPAD